MLATGRSPPEIAYQLGELLHNHFRTRGVTLTSYELRRLVAELLALHGPTEEGQSRRPGEESPVGREPVVAFDRELPKTRGRATSGGAACTARVRHRARAAAVADRDRDARERHRANRRRLSSACSPAPWISPRAGSSRESPPRGRAEAAKPATSEPAPEPPVPAAKRPEPCDDSGRGPGLIDRLWSDRAVKAIFVNGPQQVFVEREGALHAVERASLTRRS